MPAPPWPICPSILAGGTEWSTAAAYHSKPTVSPPADYPLRAPSQPGPPASVPQTLPGSRPVLPSGPDQAETPACAALDACFHVPANALLAVTTLLSSSPTSSGNGDARLARGARENHLVLNPSYRTIAGGVRAQTARWPRPQKALPRHNIITAAWNQRRRVVRLTRFRPFPGRSISIRRAVLLLNY